MQSNNLIFSATHTETLPTYYRFDVVGQYPAKEPEWPQYLESKPDPEDRQEPEEFE